MERLPYSEQPEHLPKFPVLIHLQLFCARTALLQLPLTCTPRQGCASRSGSWPRSPAPCPWSRREQWSPGGNCHTACGDREHSQGYGAAPDLPESTRQHCRNLTALLLIPASLGVINSPSPALSVEGWLVLLASICRGSSCRDTKAHHYPAQAELSNCSSTKCSSWVCSELEQGSARTPCAPSCASQSTLLCSGA